jgi:hypothetical protein
MSVEERPFDVRAERRDTGVVVVASGEIDLWSAPDVRAAMGAHEARDRGVVLVLREVGGGSDAHRILEMSGLTKVLEFVDDPDAFLAGAAER